MSVQYRILIVDDSLEWLRSHKQMLKSLFENDFFQIDTATSGKKAFFKVIEQNKDPYNLIITDLEMELIFDDDYAGIWLVKNLINREECKNTKFLIISGSYNIKEVAESLKTEYIPKSLLINSPLSLKYKVMDMLGIEQA